MSVEVYPDADALATAIAGRITARLALVQAEGRTPSIVLTGGSIATSAYRRIVDDGVDWSDVDVYWGDERFVPVSHEDRNDKQARDAFLTRLRVPDARLHVMPAHGCGTGTAEAADLYAAELPDVPFDLVLLGVGPDGHIASLFPGRPEVHENHRRAVEVFDSPKPPRVRISLTLPAINNADSVWFLVSGVGKAAAAAHALGGSTVDETPAAGAKGLIETVWLMDGPAASRLHPWPRR